METTVLKEVESSSGNYGVGVITEITEVTHDLRIYRIQPEFEFPEFFPGQYAVLGRGKDRWDDIKTITERQYSIVSSPHELPSLEFCIELIPPESRTSKSLTPRLWDHRIGIGDCILMRKKAKGSFLLFDPKKDEERIDSIVLIATVAGIAPFMSYLRAYGHGYYHRSLHFYVFHSASCRHELVYRDELEKFTRPLGDVDYISMVSQEPGNERAPYRNHNVGWTGEVGRVNIRLRDLFPYFDIKPSRNRNVFVCGHQGMLDDLTYGSFKKEWRDIQNGHPEKKGWLMQYGFSCEQVRKEPW